MKKLKLLLLGKDTQYSRYLKKLLKNLGISNIISTFSLKNAFKFFQANKISIILMNDSFDIEKTLDFASKILKYDPKAKIITIVDKTRYQLAIRELSEGILDVIPNYVSEKYLIRGIKRSLREIPLDSAVFAVSEFYLQLFEDLEKYLEPELFHEVETLIWSHLKEFSKEVLGNPHYNEGENRLCFSNINQVSLAEINGLFLKIIELAKDQLERHFPHAEGVFIEDFRFSFFRAQKWSKNIKNQIIMPDWLKSQEIWLNSLMEVLT